MNFKYWFGALISFPLLPLMYYQGKRIRTRVPSLPEAKGPEGTYLGKVNQDRFINILFLGESTMAGVGVKTHQEGFTGTFAELFSQQFKTSVQWKVYARSGYTAKRVSEKLVPKIQEKHAHLIVIGLGGNDAFTLNRPWRWRKDIKVLINNLKSKFPDAVFLFINMPPIKAFPAFTTLIKFTIGNLVEILGKELENVVDGEENVFYFSDRISLEHWVKTFEVKNPEKAFFSDGVHPSKLTYQTWAKDAVLKTYDHQELRKKMDQLLM